MKQLVMALVIASSVPFAAFGCDSWQQQQAKQRQQAEIDAQMKQRLGVQIPINIMHNLSPYNTWQAQQHNNQLFAAQQAALFGKK